MPLNQRKTKHFNNNTSATASSSGNANKKKNSIPFTTSAVVICWKIKAFLIGFASQRNSILGSTRSRIERNNKAYFLATLGCCIYFIHFIRIGNELHHSKRDIYATIRPKPSTFIQNKDNNKSKKRTISIERPSSNTSIRLQIFSLKKSAILSSSVHKYPEPVLRSPNPNYGGLKLNFLGEDYSMSSTATSKTIKNRWSRQVHIDQNHAMSGHVYTRKDFEKGWRSFDKYYAFDDDFVRNEAFDDKENLCRRVAWHRLYNPNCNTIHENEVVPLGKGENRFLGSGSYRAAFFMEGLTDPELVIKVQRFSDPHYETDRYEFVRMDALIMERLTASPRIVDVYGHCAVSVLTEFLPKELDGIAAPFESRRRQTRIVERQKEENDIKPINNLSIQEKLVISIQMAEAIADLHGFKDGVIVHDDIQLPQFLFSKEGKIKLNDFNRGEAMLFNEEKGEYCRYRNGAGGGDWRAPEEYDDGYLNEKIDVWSFGNNVYALLTGLYVFHDTFGEGEYKIIKKKILNGEKTVIDPVYRTRSHIEGSLVKIIEKCWTADPDERPSIFELLEDLKRI